MNKLARLLLVLTIGCAALQAAAQVVANTAIGRIIVASGDVELLRAGASTPATIGAALHVGDRVRTGAAGNAQLWFTDSSVVALRHASEFHVEQYRFDNRDESDNLVFSLLKGGLRTMAGLIGANNRMAYRVRTPIATLGRRGTQYALVYCQDDCEAAGEGAVANGTYGGVFDGRVAVSNNAGEVEFSAGEYFYVVDVNSIPRPLLGPPAFLADRLRGLGKGVAKPAAETATAARQEASPAAAASATTGGAASGSSGTPATGSNEPAQGGSTATASNPGDAAATPAAAAAPVASSATSTTASAGSTPADPSTSSSWQSPGASTSATTSATTTTAAGPTTTTSAATTTAQATTVNNIVASVPVTSFTSTTTVGSGGSPVVVPSAAPPTPTLGMTAAWFVTPPITFVEDPWGRTMFAAPAVLHTSGSGSAERLTGFSIYLPDALNTSAQTAVTETMIGDVSTGSIDMTGYDGTANIHWGRWVSGTVYKTNKPPGVEAPLTGIHYMYGNPTPDTVIASRTGSISYSDIGGTTAVDSTGAPCTGCSGIGSIAVNFTTRTGSISSVNYVFPTATYAYSNLPFQVFVQPGAGAWLGADLGSVGTCTGSGCSGPNAGAVFNGIFFGPTGSYIGLSFHGSSGSHTSGFSVVRLFH